MTYQEAIDWMDAFKRTYKGSPKEKEACEACDMAIEVLREVQSYRSIKDMTLGVMTKALKEFWEIGTIEECREAVGKQKAKQIIKIRKGEYCCPKCYTVYDNCIFEYDYCINCGQAIRWDENLEGMGDEL